MPCERRKDKSHSQKRLFVWRCKTSSASLDKERSILSSADLGRFYSHVNSRLSHKDDVAPLFNSRNELVISEIDKAEVLNDFFVSVGVVDNGVFPCLNSKSKHSVDKLSIVYADEGKVGRAIDRLKAKSSAGPDGLPPILFKQLKRSLTQPLCILFNLIMQCGYIPSSWKIANVTPVFKKGVSSDPGNYRPISITSVCCKLFESVIKQELILYISERSLISTDQHGFLNKHSTCTNLLEVVDDWSMNLDLKKDTLIAYKARSQKGERGGG